MHQLTQCNITKATTTSGDVGLVAT